MNDTISVGERTFRVSVERDEDMGPPWKEHDGHGVVTEWETRDKAPHERIVASDRNSYRYYDVRESLAIAQRDGWGCSHCTLEKGKFKHGHKTKREAIACAVDQDFERMRAWCNDEWQWVGVVVTMLDDEGAETDVTDSLWGIEGDSDDYLASTARDMAESLCHGLDAQLADAEALLR